MRKIALAPALTVLLLSLSACGGGKSSAPSPSPTSPPASSATPSGSPSGPVTATEKADLVHVRGQETVGKDAYQDFAKRYGKPFVNLAASQSTLVSTVTGMMKRFDVPDPMSSAAPGHFPDPVLQQRYDTIVHSGTSASAAVTAMEGHERQTSSDLQRILSHTSQSDLRQMYTHLKQAADRHLGTLQQHH